MSGIINIISENRKTFYNFDTGNHISQQVRFFYFLVFSAIFATFIYGDLKEFLAGILNVLAIVCGFSFTTLFHLSSERDIGAKEGTDIREDKHLGLKLKKLSSEIFYNVSYFIVVATAAIVLALVNLSQSATIGVEHVLKLYFTLGDPDLSSDSSQAIKNIRFLFSEYVTPVVSWSCKFILFMLLFESIFTFIRIVNRLNYLFRRRLDI